LFVTLGTENVVSEGGVDLDLLGNPFSSITFSVVGGDSARVEDITSDAISAVVVVHVRLADLDGSIFAVFVRAVLTDLDVSLVLRNDLVVGVAFTENALLFNFGSMRSSDFSDSLHVNLESVGNTSLDVSGPFGDAAGEGGINDVTIINVDLEGLTERREFFVPLEVVFLSHGLVFSVLDSELDIAQLNIQVVTGDGDVEFSGNVESGTERNIIVGSSNDYGRVFVHVFLARCEQVSSGGTLHHPSGHAGKGDPDNEAQS
jgi:hypothetical protein